MKRYLILAIVLISLLAFPITGCASKDSVAVAGEGIPRPLPIHEPIGYYEFLERTVIPIEETEEDISTENITTPIAHLTLQNTGNETCQHTLQITFYAMDKLIGDTEKTTLEIPDTRLLREKGRIYSKQYEFALATGESQTFDFPAPEIDMFYEYWFWQWEIAPPESVLQAMQRDQEPQPKMVRVKVPLSYKVVDSFIEPNVGSCNITYACVTVKNTDNVSGYFTVSFTFYRNGEVKEINNRFGADELQPDKVQTYKWGLLTGFELEPDLWTWEYEVEPGYKWIEVPED